MLLAGQTPWHLDGAQYEVGKYPRLSAATGVVEGHEGTGYEAKDGAQRPDGSC